MSILKPNTIFFGIFDQVQSEFATRREAYDEAERVFGEMCSKGFGKPFRKFDSYESFLSAYNRETNKVIGKKSLSFNNSSEYSQL